MRLLLTFWLGTLLAQPTPSGPMWKRTLSADDQRQADLWDALARQRLQGGKLGEARTLALKTAELRQRVQGKEHWQTVNAHRVVGAIDRMATLSADQKRRLTEAGQTEKQANDHLAKGEFDKGLPLLEKALAAYTELTGPDSHEAVNAAAALAAALAEAPGDPARAIARIAELQTALRKRLGDRHPDVLGLYNPLGLILYRQGRHDELVAQSREGRLACEDALGEEGLTLDLAGNEALGLAALGRYAEAEPLLGRVLALRRGQPAAGGEPLARACADLADNLATQGRLAEAEALQREALTLLRRSVGETHPQTASAYHALANTLAEQGRSAEAEALDRRALDLASLQPAGPDNPAAVLHAALATRLARQDRPVDARAQADRAVALLEKDRGDDHPATALALLRRGGLLLEQERHQGAERDFARAHKVLETRHGKDSPQAVLSAILWASALVGQGKLDDAEKLLDRVEPVVRDLFGPGHEYSARYHGLRLTALRARGKYEEAEKAGRSAVEQYDRARSPRTELAVVLARQGQPEAAWEQLETALARALLDDPAAWPSTDRERAERQRLVGQVAILERRLGNLLSASDLPDEQRQKAVSDLAVQRGRARAELTRFEDGLAERYGPVAGQVFRLAQVQARLSPRTALVAWVDLPGLPGTRTAEGEHWACVVRREGKPVWLRLPGLWDQDDLSLPGGLRALLRRRPREGNTPWRTEAEQLYAQRLQPLREALKGALHLVVLPSEALAGVPVEVLVAAAPKGEPRYVVSYAPSGTLFAWLLDRRREREDKTRPAGPELIALADPSGPPSGETTKPAEPPDHGLYLLLVLPGGNADLGGLKSGDVLLRYGTTKLAKPDDLRTAEEKADGKTPVPVEVWRQGKVLKQTVLPGRLEMSYAPGPAADEVRESRKADEVLARIGGGAFEPMAEGRREVQTLASLFDRSVVHFGKAAGQRELDRLKKDGQLGACRYLHLALPGSSGDQVSRSSLALAGEGRLTAEGVLRSWQLRAEVVTLSGEGGPGFAWALFTAGADSVVVGLWPVHDEAAGLLMTRFYANLLGRGRGSEGALPGTRALAEAKEWLRGLSADDVARLRKLDGAARMRAVVEHPGGRPAATAPFAHPFYWAGFVLVGDPG